MDRFPQELLRFIVEDVPYESLEPLRLVNRAFAAAAAPFLFEVIPLWISVRSLERLTAISEHPQLSQYPKQIIFSPLRFIDYESHALYRAKVKDWLEYQPASLSILSLTLAKHMSAYCSYIEAQRFLSSKALDVKILSRAFSLLSHVEILNVDYWDTAIGSAELIHAFGAFKAQDLLTCDCRQTLPVLIRALAASSLKIKVFKLGFDEDSSYSSITGNVGDYSAAESLAWPHPSTSKAVYSCPAKISTQALSTTFCVENLYICKNALSGVLELKIGEFSVEPDDVVNLTRTLVALRNLMECAPCLESVTLEEVSSQFHAELPIPSMGRVMPPRSKHIKNLTIRGYETSLAFLVGFFERHPTIVKVELHLVTITSTNWSTALTQLRTLDFTRLESFSLYFCGDEEWNLQVQDYILRKTDKDPIVEERAQAERFREQEIARQRRLASLVAE